jgi:hypothetical protein
MFDHGIPRQQIQYPHEDIVAPDLDAAVATILSDLKGFLEHVSGERALD